MVRHKRASLQAAQQKAKEICEAVASCKQEVNGWDGPVFAEVTRALEILPPQCLRIDRAAQIILDSLRYVDADTIVEACRCHRKNDPGRFTPKLAKEVTEALLDRQRGHVSARRVHAETFYLNSFNATFGERVLGGVQSSELSKMIDHQGWSKATRNDALGTYSRLYTFAIGENWAFDDPATSEKIARRRLGMQSVRLHDCTTDGR